MRIPPRGITVNLTVQQKLTMKWYPVPGWIGDPLPREHKFEKWEKLPKASHRLYWRLHPEAYAKMNNGKRP